MEFLQGLSGATLGGQAFWGRRDGSCSDGVRARCNLEGTALQGIEVGECSLMVEAVERKPRVRSSKESSGILYLSNTSEIANDALGYEAWGRVSARRCHLQSEVLLARAQVVRWLAVSSIGAALRRWVATSLPCACEALRSGTLPIPLTRRLFSGLFPCPVLACFHPKLTPRALSLFCKASHETRPLTSTAIVSLLPVLLFNTGSNLPKPK